MFVVCTGRGRHKEVRITFVRWHEDGTWTMPGHGEWAPPIPDAKAGFPRGAYAFECSDPTCLRNPQIHREKWIRLIKELRRVGVGRVDISLLPF